MRLLKLIFAELIDPAGKVARELQRQTLSINRPGPVIHDVVMNIDIPVIVSNVDRRNIVCTGPLMRNDVAVDLDPVDLLQLNPEPARACVDIPSIQNDVVADRSRRRFLRPNRLELPQQHSAGILQEQIVFHHSTRSLLQPLRG